MGKEVILHQPENKDQTAELVLSLTQLRKYMRQLHKENKKQIVITVTLPRPMIPEAKKA